MIREIFSNAAYNTTLKEKNSFEFKTVKLRHFNDLKQLQPYLRSELVHVLENDGNRIREHIAKRQSFAFIYDHDHKLDFVIMD